jgi:aldehyde:ferredoxin oxidoreductase
MRAYPIADEVLEGTRPADSMEGKAEQVIQGNVDNGFIGQNFSSVKFSGIYCDFWAVNPDQLCQMFKHVWKREFTDDEIMLIGERIWNLGRLFNLREGVEPDTLPRKLYVLEAAFAEGPSAGKAIGEQGFKDGLQEYYRLRGWDENGVPTEAKLAELGVDVRL